MCEPCRLGEAEAEMEPTDAHDALGIGMLLAIFAGEKCSFRDTISIALQRVSEIGYPQIANRWGKKLLAHIPGTQSWKGYSTQNALETS